jgi:hypothetical protein
MPIAPEPESMQVPIVVPPPVVKVEAPRVVRPAPSPARPSRKKSKKVKPQSRTLAPLLGVLAALLGYLAATVEWNAPAPKPVVAVVKVVPVVLELPPPAETEVERVIVDGPLMISPELASVADPPPVVVTAKAVAKQAKKVKRKRTRDEAPIPPWLVKRSRR